MSHGQSVAAPPRRAAPSLSRSLAGFLARRFAPRYTVSRVAGDASARDFFRVRSSARTAILILHPEPLPAGAPIFSNHRILKEIGAPVPRILGSDPGLGAVLVQDFGDETLQQYLLGRRAGGSQASHQSRRTGARAQRAPRRDARLPKEVLYRRACDLIVLMQTRAGGVVRPDDFAAGSALDRERFLFELDHFHRHYLGGLRGLRPDASDESLLRAFYADLAERCDALPRAYCHRDFQSRNLMVRPDGRLGLIDFQDARMGPYTYDAASLLRDSSLDLEDDLVDRMLARLAAGLGAAPEELRADFDLMALQRNIKDLGTFGYMAAARGRASYLRYVPRTLRFIRRTLAAARRYDLFYPVIDRLVLSGAPPARRP